MYTNQNPDIHIASQLFRRGRYAEAAATLQRVPIKVRSRDGLGDALLADVLQRVGQNLPAEEIALRHLRGLTQTSPLYARYHFVLGNIERDRGNTATAIHHLQIAAGSSNDLELACWTQLRLIGAIAEVSGVRTAIARLDEIKRTLTRFGDARPFAALHLWLVEAESTRGNLKVLGVIYGLLRLYYLELTTCGFEDTWRLTGQHSTTTPARYAKHTNGLKPQSRTRMNRTSDDQTSRARKSRKHSILAGATITGGSLFSNSARLLRTCFSKRGNNP